MTACGEKAADRITSRRGRCTASHGWIGRRQRRQRNTGTGGKSYDL